MTTHWSARYVGRPCHSGEESDFDCADLAALVRREVFAHEIALPHRDYRACKGASRLRATVAQVDARLADFATKKTASPEDGDCVLLLCRGRPTHIGVWCVIDGDDFVLHATSASRQVVLTRPREIARYGMAVEGVYAWN